MEILIIAGVFSLSIVLSVSVAGFAAVIRSENQFGTPKEILELKKEMDEYKRIINALDQEGLEVLEQRIEALTGQIRENNVKGVLGR